MPITSTNTFSLATIQKVFIDCSVVQDGTASQQLNDLIDWVQTIRMRSSIHVTLRSATGSITGRKIRTRFQSLGCRVSMQTDFSRI